MFIIMQAQRLKLLDDGGDGHSEDEGSEAGEDRRGAKADATDGMT
jgi:hypothetical protein